MKRSVFFLGWTLLAGAMVPARSAAAPPPAAAASPGRSWISNVSVLAGIDAPGDSYIIGYVVAGSGEKRVLIRAVGPSLAAYGVTNPLPDPKVELYRGSAQVGENDNWGGGADLVAAMAAVGAFPYQSASSADAATLATIAPGANSARVVATDTRTGTALGEVYDATPAGQFDEASARLVNVSVLKRINRSLTVGFLIAGEAPKTVLVRAVGPTLAAAPYNVAGGLPNPTLSLYAAGQKLVATNDDWAGNAALAEAFAVTGAFALPPNSRDAAVLAQLEPGSYTAVVTDATGAAGYGLVEAYEVTAPIAPNPATTPFTLAMLPDTQYYTRPGSPRYGELAMFTAQTDWIQAHGASHNIAYVAHVGDISDDGDTGGTVPAATQWANANDAMSRLERPVSVPFGLAVGNHDEEPNGDPNGTTTRYNETFGVSRFAGRPYYGGHYGTNNNNHYDLFTAGGRDYLAVYVAYDANNEKPDVTSWAGQIVAAYPNRQAILVTHYMAGAGADYSSFGAQGSRLFNALKPNRNFFLALGGHVSGNMSYRRDPSGPFGADKVTTLVADYQFEPRGGAGFMRLYTLAPAYGYLNCRTYSPFLDEYKTDYGNEFTQSLDPRGAAEEGAVAFADGTIAVAAVLARTAAGDTADRSTVCVSFQARAKANEWSAWLPLEGVSGVNQARAVVLRDDRLAVVAGGRGSDAWVRWQTARGVDGGWSVWTPVPGTPTQSDGSKALGYVKAVRLTDDRLAIVGWSDGGAVYASVQNAVGGTFGPWSSLGGSGFRQGDVVRLSDNRLVVLAVADGGSVQCNVQQAAGGTWAGWTAISGGGKLFTYVGAVAKPDDTVAVFGVRPEAPTQSVYMATSASGGTGWTTLASIGSGGAGFARIHAVTRLDGTLALFGSPEHGVAAGCIQGSPGGAFGTWQPLTTANRWEIGSVCGVVLRDDSLAAVSHGAATGENYAFQAARDGSWTITGGLPVAWTR